MTDITLVETEREEWNRRAETMSGARHEACSDDSLGAWATSIVAHLGMIVPRIAPQLGSGLFFDLGCGVGRLMIPMAHMIPDGVFVGLDISVNMLNWLAERSKERNLLCSIIPCDGRTLPGLDDVYEAGYSVTMCQHIPPEAVRGYLREVYRILVPGGIFVFQYVEGDERAPFMYQFDRDEVVAWCVDAGFNVTGSRRDPNQYNWRWITVRK